MNLILILFLLTLFLFLGVRLSGTDGGGGSSSAGLLQAQSVKLTGGNITTSSTSLVDLTGATVTMTTGAHRCLVIVNMMGSSSNGSDIRVALLIDGVNQGGATFGNVFISNIQAVTASVNFNFTFLTDVLTAASHTFKLQWYTTAGTATAFAGTAGQSPLVFQVLETGLTV